jgi:hypothetical protein
MGWLSASRPGRILRWRKDPSAPVPIGQEAGWAPETVWTQRLEEKAFASVGDRTSIARSSRPYEEALAEWKLAEASEEGQGPHRAVEPMMMMALIYEQTVR